MNISPLNFAARFSVNRPPFFSRLCDERADFAPERPLVSSTRMRQAPAMLAAGEHPPHGWQPASTHHRRGPTTRSLDHETHAKGKQMRRNLPKWESWQVANCCQKWQKFATRRPLSTFLFLQNHSEIRSNLPQFILVQDWSSIVHKHR